MTPHDPYALFGAPLESGQPADTPRVEGVPFADRVGDAFEASRRIDNIGGADILIREEMRRRLDAIEQSTGKRLRNPFTDRFDEVDEIEIMRSYRDQGRGFTAEAQRRIVALKLPLIEQEIAALASEFPDIETSERFEASIQARAEELRLQQELAGFWPGLVGGAGASFTDPLNLGTLPFGGGGRTILGVALREAGLNAAVEAGSQPFLAAERGEIGLDLTTDEALMNIGSAALFAGALGGGGKTLERLLSGSDEALSDALDALPEDRRNPATELAAAELRRDGATSRAIGFEPEQLEDEVRALETEVLGAEAVTRADQALEADEPMPVEPGLAALTDRDDFLPQVTEDSEPPRVPAEPGEPLPHSELVTLDPSELQVDARRFQFKDGGDSDGVTDALRGVEVWDPIKSGDILVWEDAQGARFVADGHQRTALARRLAAQGQTPQLRGFILREVDGVRAEDARALAAAKNIAQGTGSAIDAAKVLKVRPDLIDGSLSPRTAVYRNAQGLMELSDDAFLMVVNGVVDDADAALVGRLVQDPGEQVAILSIIHNAAPSNLTETEALIRSALAAGFSKEVTMDLFGTSDVSASLLQVRAGILSAAISRLRRDRTTFNNLVRNRDDIEAAGNTLDASQNREIAQNAQELAETVLRTSSLAGPVSDALKRAVALQQGGAARAAATQQFLNQLRELGPEALRRADASGRSAGAGRAGEQAETPNGTVEATTADLNRAAPDLFDDPVKDGAEQAEGLTGAVINDNDPPADEALLVGLDVDDNGNTVPVTMSRRELQDEIAQEDDMFARLEGCVR